MADGLEIIGRVPGKVGRNQEAHYDQGEPANRREQGPPRVRIDHAGESQSDEEVEHGILGEDSSTEREPQPAANGG